MKHTCILILYIHLTHPHTVWTHMPQQKNHCARPSPTFRSSAFLRAIAGASSSHVHGAILYKTYMVSTNRRVSVALERPSRLRQPPPPEDHAAPKRRRIMCDPCRPRTTSASCCHVWRREEEEGVARVTGARSRPAVALDRAALARGSTHKKNGGRRRRIGFGRS